MISVVGIGDFCSELVNKLKSYPQYDIYTIGTENTSFILSELKNAEEYEKNYPIKLNSLVKDENEEITIFVDGSEAVSGIILKFLENFKNRKINICYIRSDLELLGNIEKIQDKIAFNVLQEYTRSGLFNKFIFFDKIKIEKLLDNVSILEFDESFNELVTTTSHYINVYSNIKPIISNNIELSDISRIESYGLSEIGSLEIKWFSDLENIEEIIYYFAINSNTLKKEKKLLQTLKNQVKEKQKDNVKISFNVYETNYVENFVYCVGRTKFIQHPPSA
jgi:hypothetical protein